MDAAQIVVRDIERNGGAMRLQLLAKAIGEAGKPLHAHTDRKVAALDVAGADVFGDEMKKLME